MANNESGVLVENTNEGDIERKSAISKESLTSHIISGEDHDENYESPEPRFGTSKNRSKELKHVTSDFIESLAVQPSLTERKYQAEEETPPVRKKFAQEKLDKASLVEPEPEDERYTWKFWKALHANKGSTFGYATGFLVILLMNHGWMLEEIADSTEGHSVSKTFVTLFVIYSYSFITLGIELVQFILLCSEIYTPHLCIRIMQSVNELDEKWPAIKRLRHGAYFYTLLAVIWCMLCALSASNLWTWFWLNHTCKSHYDGSCRSSQLGQFIIAYRNDACYDGTASSVICEKFVSYLPIMILSVVFVFIGNVLLPLVNDQLALLTPTSGIEDDNSQISDFSEWSDAEEIIQQSWNLDSSKDGGHLSTIHEALSDEADVTNSSSEDSLHQIQFKMASCANRKIESGYMKIVVFLIVLTLLFDVFAIITYVM